MDALRRARRGVEFIMSVTLMICSQPRGMQEGMGAHHYLQSGVTTSGAPKLVGAGGEMCRDDPRQGPVSDGCTCS